MRRNLQVELTVNGEAAVAAMLAFDEAIGDMERM